MLPRKMQSRLKMQLERPWMSEPGLLVDRKAHHPNGSVNLARNQSRERRQLRRSALTQPEAQSLAPPGKHLRPLAEERYRIGSGEGFHRGPVRLREACSISDNGVVR